MMPEVVRFSGGGNPFRVEVARCGDLNCECTDLFFDLREVAEDGRPVPGGQALRIRIDGDTWQEIEPPARGPRVTQIVQELLEGYPAKGREHLQRQVRAKRRAARRLKDYRFPLHLMEEGRLIAFREIISDGLDGTYDAWSFAYEWSYGDDYYLLDDRYCPNPGCKCREVHVSFVRCGRPGETGKNRASKELFTASLSLNGKWRIRHCYECTEAEAKAILGAWRRDEPEHLANFRWRYDKVKEIARRSFRRRGRLSEDDVQSFGPPMNLPLELPGEEPDDEEAGQPPAGAVRAGRNEPCPCGSGKKYKKCCGRR